MMRQILILMMTLALILTAALPVAFAQMNRDLTGTQWQLLQLDGTSLPDNVQITLEFFEENQAGGSAGCNQYGSSYTIDGVNLTLGNIISTMMACPGDVMDYESSYLAALQSVISYEVMGDQLTLTTSDGVQLIFAPMVTLPGTSWQLQSYGDTDVTNGQTVTIEFADDMSASGDTGCNLFNTTYTLEGESIAFGEIVSTRRACISEDAVALENAYLDALQAAQTYSLSGDQLRIAYGDGDELVFERVLSLADTSWQLESIDGAFVMEGRPVTLTLGSDGSASGSSGCNQYGGGYTVDGDAISFSQLFSTMMACLEDGVMDQESAYLAALGSATRFELASDQLTIFYGDGGMLVFSAVTE